MRYPLVDVSVDEALSVLSDPDIFRRDMLWRIYEAVSAIESKGIIIKAMPDELYEKALKELRTPYSRNSGKHAKRKFKKGDPKRFEFTSEMAIVAKIIDVVGSLLKRERHAYWHDASRLSEYIEDDHRSALDTYSSNSDDLLVEELGEGTFDTESAIERNDGEPPSLSAFRLNPEQIMMARVECSNLSADEHPAKRLLHRLRRGQLGKNRRKYAEVGAKMLERILDRPDLYLDANQQDGSAQPRTNALAIDMGVNPNLVSKVWGLLRTEIAAQASLFEEASNRARRAAERKVAKRNLRRMRDKSKQRLANIRQEVMGCEFASLGPNTPQKDNRYD